MTVAVLEARLQELVALAEVIEDDVGEFGEYGGSEVALGDDEVFNASGNTMHDEIREIKWALAAIETGSYGVCVSCKNSIEKERLKTLPHTSRCGECA